MYGNIVITGQQVARQCGVYGVSLKAIKYKYKYRRLRSNFRLLRVWQ
jgi:hypothetical protein